MATRRTPAGLSPRARKYYREFLDEYELDGPSDYLTLEEAARTLSTIETLEAEVARLGPIIPDERGSTWKANPAQTELTRTRALLDRLVARITPRDEPTAASAGRALARARHGAGR